MAIFTGAGVALITPMNEDGSVNFTKLEEIIEFQIANGTDAIIICGTTGEASTLSDEEHLSCIRFACEVTKKRIPVIAGTGSNCTESAVYLSQEAEKCGVDGLLVVTPYYNKATQNGLKAHYKTIAASVKVPIILYNVPSRTGTAISPQTVVDLCTEVPNIVGVKDATGDLSEVAQLLSIADGKVDVYSGNDDQIVPVLSLGGKGVISVLSNILPQETHDMVETFLNGEVEKSRELQLRYFALIKALFSEVNPIPVKKAMNLMGMEVGSLRLPLTEMEEKNAAKLADEMKKAGISVK
jgi:4-hydroxy-tetrahydrodipicolinate synthase